MASKKKHAHFTIEKIHNGILILDPEGRKIYKSTLNGLIELLKSNWDIKYINEDTRQKTSHTLDEYLDVEELLIAEEAKSETAPTRKPNRRRKK